MWKRWVGTLPASPGPGCRDTEHGRSVGIWGTEREPARFNKTLCGNRRGEKSEVDFTVVPGRRRRVPALRLSSWGSPPSLTWGGRRWGGTPGCAGSRCLSWRTGPWRPSHRFHSGRHRRGRRTLPRQTESFVIFFFLAQQLVDCSVCRGLPLVPFLPSRPAGSTLTTPSADWKKNWITFKMIKCVVLSAVWIAEHTNYFHWIHMIHKVSLCQVEGNLKKTKQETVQGSGKSDFWNPRFPSALWVLYYSGTTYMSVSTGLLEYPEKVARRVEMSQWSLSGNVSP